MYPIPLAIFIVCSLAALGAWLWYQSYQYTLVEDILTDQRLASMPLTEADLQTCRDVVSYRMTFRISENVYAKYRSPGETYEPGIHYEEYMGHKTLFAALVLAAETYVEPNGLCTHAIDYRSLDLEEPVEVSPHAHLLEMSLEDGSTFLPYDLYNEWYSGEPFTVEEDQDTYMFLLICAAEGVL